MSLDDMLSNPSRMWERATFCGLAANACAFKAWPHGVASQHLRRWRDWGLVDVEDEPDGRIRFTLRGMETFRAILRAKTLGALGQIEDRE